MKELIGHNGMDCGDALPMQTVPATVSPNDWHPVDPAALPETWPRYRSLILSSLERGEGSFDERDILAALLTERSGIFAVERQGETVAVCIVEIVNFPRRRKLVIRYVAGESALMIDALPRLEEKALAAGCDSMEIFARRGWGKMLPDWSHNFVIMQKDLTP